MLEWFIVFLGFVFGATWASFFGVVFERGRNQESIGGRSHCACGRQLLWYENIPVFGWLRILGKTKCCNTRIPAWYFVSEVITGLVFGFIVWLLISSWL